MLAWIRLQARALCGQDLCAAAAHPQDLAAVWETSVGSINLYVGFVCWRVELIIYSVPCNYFVCDRKHVKSIFRIICVFNCFHIMCFLCILSIPRSYSYAQTQPAARCCEYHRSCAGRWCFVLAARNASRPPVPLWDRGMNMDEHPYSSYFHRWNKVLTHTDTLANMLGNDGKQVGKAGVCNQFCFGALGPWALLCWTRVVLCQGTIPVFCGDLCNLAVKFTTKTQEWLR